MKRCSKCGTEKARDQFHKGVVYSDGLNPWCIACRQAWRKARQIPKVIQYKTVGPDGLRECSKCKERKLPTEFYTDKRAHDGLKHQCKKCHEGYTKVWSERNPGKRTAISRKSQLVHKDKHKAWTKAWQQKNKAHLYVLRKQWIEKNKEHFTSWQREYQRQWKKQHPDSVAVDNSRRRARKSGAKGSYTEAEIKTLYSKQRGKCAHPWCAALLKNGYHRDHIVALASGGSNFIENIQLLCPQCNTTKATKDPIAVMQAHGYLI